jgi:hypothetical protein
MAQLREASPRPRIAKEAQAIEGRRDPRLYRAGEEGSLGWRGGELDPGGCDGNIRTKSRSAE